MRHHLPVFLAAFLPLAMPSLLPGQDNDPLPTTPSPLFAKVTAIDHRAGTFDYFVVVPLAPKLNDPPGTPLRLEKRVRKGDVNRLAFFDGADRRLSPKESWKGLGLDTWFLISTDGMPMPGFHLRLVIREEKFEIKQGTGALK
jgi:hypothetical protein